MFRISTEIPKSLQQFLPPSFSIGETIETLQQAQQDPQPIIASILDPNSLFSKTYPYACAAALISPYHTGADQQPTQNTENLLLWNHSAAILLLLGAKPWIVDPLLGSGMNSLSLMVYHKLKENLYVYEEDVQGTFGDVAMGTDPMLVTFKKPAEKYLQYALSQSFSVLGLFHGALRMDDLKKTGGTQVLFPESQNKLPFIHRETSFFHDTPDLLTHHPYWSGVSVFSPTPAPDAEPVTAATPPKAPRSKPVLVTPRPRPTPQVTPEESRRLRRDARRQKKAEENKRLAEQREKKQAQRLARQKEKAIRQSVEELQKLHTDLRALNQAFSENLDESGDTSKRMRYQTLKRNLSNAVARLASNEPLTSEEKKSFMTLVQNAQSFFQESTTTTPDHRTRLTERDETRIENPLEEIGMHIIRNRFRKWD